MKYASAEMEIIFFEIEDIISTSGKRSAKRADKVSTPDQEDQDPKAPKRTDYTNCYQAKYLLTKNEWYAHKKLKEIADQKGLTICPKVRMLDIVEPRKGEKDWKTLLHKIQAKHLDFVICDQSMRIKAVLELDDNSHDQKDRQARDTFVDEVLKSVGYKVIHTRYITEAILDGLTDEETK